MSEDRQEKIDGRRKPQRKVEILQAVMHLLEEGGKVTTAALAERMGLSEAALYRHFRGKDAIFQSLVDYVEDHLLQPAGKVLHESEPRLEELGHLFEYHLRFLADHPGLCRIFLLEGLTLEAPALGERMVLVMRKYTTQIKQILRRCQAAGNLAEEVPVETAAAILVGMVQSRALRYVMSGFKESPHHEWEAAWHFFVRGVGHTP